jgi:hypothetical protein
MDRPVRCFSLILEHEEHLKMKSMKKVEVTTCQALHSIIVFKFNKICCIYCIKGSLLIQNTVGQN